MSWSKNNGRFQQIVVPLDSLVREKENKNSREPILEKVAAKRMKFGGIQFTSIRGTSCYNMSLSSTSPIPQDSESPSNQNELNDNNVSVEQVPKPRKFFKSRNAAPPPTPMVSAQHFIQMSSQAMHSSHQIRQPAALLNDHLSTSGDDAEPAASNRKKRGKTSPVKKEKPPKLEKSKKEKPMKVVKAKEPPRTPKQSDVESLKRREKTQVEPTRSSGRSRAKAVNYNEDAGEDEFQTRIERRIVPKHATATSEAEAAQSLNISPVHTENPPSSSQQVSSIHPPIVLRISKGTSRLISTDNEDGVKSPVHDNSSSDENKNVTNESAVASTDELIAMLSSDAPVVEETISAHLKIKIKKDYIKSYNESLKEEATASASKKVTGPIISESSSRVTRRRGKQQETTASTIQRISPVVSEFDSQSSVLGSVCSQNTTTTQQSNPREDCRVIHSRGSSVVTSDMDGTSQQSSMAAAPPSGSENNSITVLESVRKGAKEPLAIAQKPKRGRKKALDAIEMPTQENQTAKSEPIAKKTRNTRQNKISISIESLVETQSAPLESVPEQKTTGRITRNKRNATTTGSTSAEIPQPKEFPLFKDSSPRFFTRKRKNQNPDVTKSFAPTEDDQSSALNLSQKSSVPNSTISIANDHLNALAAVSSSTSDPTVPEYKHKKLIKRSWESGKSLPIDLSQPEPHSMTTRSPSKQVATNNNNLQRQSATEQKLSNDNSGVKLLISKKKGSIFKSRALDKDEDNNKKRLNLYKHKWDEDAEMMENVNESNQKPTSFNVNSNSTADQSYFDGEPSGLALTRFTKHQKSNPSKVEQQQVPDEFDDDTPIAGFRCDRNAKKYYQVVRNVKKAHQIQEIGEFQEMDDESEYLLDALQPNIQVATRCLSALQLASKCMTPSFRMHIRAHGIVPKFFKALGDAPNDPSLGLCTAMVMFALSQDTLKMDLDRDSLELMLNLLECEGTHKKYPKDSSMNRQQLEKKQKVRELCEEIQSQGKSNHLNLDNITAAQLAMESLLSLTSKRAGEWLKEDLRELGGIEHIIKTVCECCHQITDYVKEWTEPLLQKLNKIERCLRILENVTSNNEENQKYILHYKQQIFVKTLCRLYQLLDTELTLYPTTDRSPKDSAGNAIREALVPLLKVIINLTHPFNERAIGSVFFGDHKEIFLISFHLMLFGSCHIPIRHQFDLSVLSLVMLNNLAQSNEKNRQTIMQLMVPIEEFSKEKQPAVKAMIEYFYKCEDKARMIKQMTDDIFDSPKDRDAKQKSQEETVSALIQNSGSHMEHTILGSVTSILIGFVVMNNRNNEVTIRKYLRNENFNDMVGTLEKYYEFLNLTVSSEASSMAQLKTIKSVIDYLRSCDAP